MNEITKRTLLSNSRMNWHNLSLCERVALLIFFEFKNNYMKPALNLLEKEPGYLIVTTFISGHEEMEEFAEQLTVIAPKLGAFFKMKNLFQKDPIEVSDFLTIIGVTREDLILPEEE